MSLGTFASPQRVGGLARVTGAQQYLADLRLPGMLHAKLVTLDCARAKLLSVDTTEAGRVGGVRLILAARDLPQPVPRFGPQFRDRPLLAVGETKFHGEAVAAVAADSPDAAAEAVRLIRVTYEELPAVSTIAAALSPDAPLVQDPDLRPGDPLGRTNVLREHRFGWGDVEAAPHRVVIEGRYTFPMVTQFALETHGVIAAPEGDGIAVWSTIQHPFWLQRILAEVLELPLAKVRVIAPDPGGAFGGKQHAKHEPLLAVMALRTGRPVRLLLTLEETAQTVRRNAAEVRVRTGFLEDGTITFREVEADYLLGAYADIADRTVSKGGYSSCGPYRIPAARIVARSILTHTPPSTAFRGFGSPQPNWAVESNMDEAARALGIDPMELRLRNLPDRGEAFIPGDTPADGCWKATVRRAAELIGWDTQPPAGRGRGIAVGMKSGPTTGHSYATVRLLGDGSAIVLAGTSDMGQGARTVFAQIAARELGLPLQRITVIMGDTAVVPYDAQTSASRSTVLMGNAVLQAAREVQRKVGAMAARLHGLEDSAVSVHDGVVQLPASTISVLEVLQPGLGPLGGEVIGNGESRKESQAAHPLSGSAAFYEFNCTAVEVAVDEGTGQVEVTRHVTVSDVGRAINPRQVQGQDEGAAIQGLGHTLMEHYILDRRGRILNLGAIDYRIPTSMDVPSEMRSDTIENGDGPGPYGAKGMSEGALLPVAAAVAAAVRDATGAVIRDLPLTPERVWRALSERPQSWSAAPQRPEEAVVS